MSDVNVMLLAVLIVTGMVGIAPVIAIADTAEAPSIEQVGASNDTVEPGERMMGVIGAEGAEIESELEARSFGIRVAEAESDEELAEILKDRFDRLEQRLDELDARLGTVQDRFDEGEIPPGQYKAQVTQIEAERAALERSLASGINVSEQLPHEVLEQNDINMTAIYQLHERAHQMGGEQIREIARSIAGPGVGGPHADRPSPGDRMIDRAEHALESIDETDDAEYAYAVAERQVAKANLLAERATLLVERGLVEDVSNETLDELDRAITDANEALAEARTAADANETEQSIAHSHEAVVAAIDALEIADDIVETNRGPPGERPGPGDGAGPPWADDDNDRGPGR